MDDGVIVDGQDIDMPLNLKTIGDHLQEAGWKTSAYGKWDCGMTAWPVPLHEGHFTRAAPRGLLHDGGHIYFVLC